jgi:hypothetical protein
MCHRNQCVPLWVSLFYAHNFGSDYGRKSVHDLIVYSICISVTVQLLSHKRNVNDTLLIALTAHIKNGAVIWGSQE